MTETLVWKTCPHCSRDVSVLAGRITTHTTPREMRRWPKVVEECPRSRTEYPALVDA